MRTALVTLIVLAAPRAALACPVCFGENDSPQAKAMNAGIVLMLGVVIVMMALFASFFVSLVRRARLADAELVRAGSERGAEPHAIQKGTAQC
jgi:hypothetical protein